MPNPISQSLKQLLASNPALLWDSASLESAIQAQLSSRIDRAQLDLLLVPVHSGMVQEMGQQGVASGGVVNPEPFHALLQQQGMDESQSRWVVACWLEAMDCQAKTLATTSPAPSSTLMVAPGPKNVRSGAHPIVWMLAGGLFVGICAWLAFLLAEAHGAVLVQTNATPPVQKVGPMGECWTNSIGMEFCRIPEGNFLMGDESNPSAQHRVTIAKPFYMGKFECTQAEWEAVMGKERNPSKYPGAHLPVHRVTWDEAKEFLKKLGEKEGGVNHYRLPSEAEWEYACRAGTTTAFWFGDNKDWEQGDKYINYRMLCGNTADTPDNPFPVGQKPANPWGLHDTHGNVGEWCEDLWHETYRNAPVNGSAWILGGEPKIRVVRGKLICSLPDELSSSTRNKGQASERDNQIGFRVVVEARQ